MASATVSKTEAKKDLFGVDVDQSTYDAVSAVLEGPVKETPKGFSPTGEVIAVLGSTPDAGPNKGKYAEYEIELSHKALVSADLRSEDDPEGPPVVEPYIALNAANVAGALKLCGGDTEKFLDLFNRAYNMYRRQIVRQRIVARLEGPQKAINQAVAAFKAMGLSEAEAEAAVKAIQARAVTS